jgi:hypothetical protein
LTLALLAPVAGATVQAQDFEGVITAKVKGMPGGGEMKTFLKGNKSRVEITAPQGAMVVISDPSAGETYMVMPAQSMIMVMKMADAERMADSLIRRNASESSLIPLGKKDEIAGHRCEWYRFREPRTANDLCLASGLGMFRGGAPVFGGGMPGRSPSMPAWAKEMMRKGMFPLKVSDTVGVAIWEVVALEKKPLEASLFVPPANYQRMQMPMGRPPQ